MAVRLLARLRLFTSGRKTSWRSMIVDPKDCKQQLRPPAMYRTHDVDVYLRGSHFPISSRCNYEQTDGAGVSNS
jgi:hypothetical protein